MNTTPPSWMKTTLRLAAIYNVLWGTWVVLFPNMFFNYFKLSPPVYPGIWQAVGMIVACYGLAYWIASYAPTKHWGIVLVGFLGKVFGPIGFVQQWMAGTLPLVFGLHNITNDLIWIIPFGLILYYSYKRGEMVLG